MTHQAHLAAVEERLRQTLPRQTVHLPERLQGDELDAAVNAVELFHLGHHAYVRQSRADVWEADSAITRQNVEMTKLCVRQLGRTLKGFVVATWIPMCAILRWFASFFR